MTRGGDLPVVQQLTAEQAIFPKRLLKIPQPPSRLYVKGNPSAWDLPCVSIVGSRKPTPYGRRLTEQFAQELAGYGIAIVSGLAFGVDSLAHRAALTAGGVTIAVLAGGLDTIYPPAHIPLAHQIIAQDGALISEYPEGTSALKHHFIARNRLIAGLSTGVLVTEAAKNSGSLHTAAFALEQGHTVMAVPGSIYSPLSQGTHNLLKAGATPVTTVNDIFEALGFTPGNATRTRPHGQDEAEEAILSLMDQGISEASQLLEQSKLEPATFNQRLTLLELRGIIRPLGADQWGLSL